MAVSTLCALLALPLTSALLLALHRPAHYLRLLDEPTRRKRHGRAVPLTGGIGIFAGFVLALLLSGAPLAAFWPLLAGMALLLVVGTVDDYRGLRPWAKLAAQVAAALLMAVGGGVVVEDLGGLLGPGLSLDLGAAAIPFTVFATVGLINAVNMLDGVDGLAGGAVAIALGWLVLAGVSAGAAIWPWLASVLVAAVCGFLVLNMRSPWRRRAACFLGDAGSMMLGLAVAWFAIRATQGAHAALPPVAALWILALPVLDTLVLTGRRLGHGRHPFHADREHLHHILYRAGFTPGPAVALILLGALLVGGAGLWAARQPLPEWGMAAGLLPLAAGHALVHLRAWRVATFLRRRLRAVRRGLRSLAGAAP